VMIRHIFNRFGQLRPTQMIVISFLTIILTGTLLLMLPCATQEKPLSLVEALFTAVSATCVTGLTVVNIGKECTLFGQIVVLALIQIGGIGIMTFSTFFIYLLGRRISMKGREIIDQTLSHTPVQNIGSLLRKIMILVFLFEAVGAGLLTLAWLRHDPFSKALYHGIFHAVSAFCNAGFSLYSTSFEGFQNDLFINLILMFLIILGGLGFIVLLDLKHLLFRPNNSLHRFTFHSKVVLSVTLSLIVIGALLIFWVERGHTLRELKPAAGILVALFQSVTARTAGFNTVHIGHLTNGACFIIMVLMFIGAAPGSCGGGVKVSTLGILLAMFFSRLTGHDETNLYYQTIPKETTGKALVIVLSSVLLICVIFFGLLLTEDWFLSASESRGHFISLAFEAISAFGTVGLSMDVTSRLTVGGRVLIMVLMFIGRLGPLTLAVALTRPKAGVRFRYAKGEVMVG
jgi:trk system potassium uptake protein TrkH